jgi:hypothetical protein
VRPARLEKLLRFGASRVPGEQRAAASQLGAREQDLAGVRVRRSWLRVQVVTVVPDRDQAEVVDRRERGGARADHDAHGAPGRREEAPVPLGRPERGRQRDVHGGVDRSGQRGVEPVEVARVGDHDQRAPAAGRTGDGCLGEPCGPVLAGQRGPHGARVPAVAKGAQERRACLVPVPEPGRGHLDGVLGAGLWRRRFGARVPWRHREP